VETIGGEAALGIGAEFRRFGNTVRWSWAGWCAAWASEKSLRQWSVAQIVSILLTYVFALDTAERALIVALGFVVLAAELGNTAIEAIVDRVSPEESEMARKAKDCGSAMVALAALAAGVAWLLVLFG